MLARPTIKQVAYHKLLMPTNGCAKGGESERGNRERSRLSLTAGEGRGAEGEQGGGRGLSLKERGEERRGNRGDQGEVEATLDQEQGSI